MADDEAPAKTTSHTVAATRGSKEPSSAHEAVSARAEDEAAPEEEAKVCVNCGEPAIYTSPDDGPFEVASFCAKHKPGNA
jgi:hypothetical protein